MTPDRTDRRDDGPIVLVLPTSPDAGGNGLAMRAGMWLEALAAAAPTHVVIVPVAGARTVSSWARARATSVTVVDPVGPDDAQRHALALLGDASARADLAATAPLPNWVRLVPPTLAPEAAPQVAAELGRVRPRALLAMREYLVPFAVALGRALGAERVAVDLDDDVEPLLEQLGHGDEAAAYRRLARHWLPTVAAVAVASAPEAVAIAERYHLPAVHEVPNTVALAAEVPPRPGSDRLLFVGNLTYGPNEQAAGLLTREVLPAVRAARAGATVDLVGNASTSVRELGALPGVAVHGFVPDLAPHYAAADVVVAPLLVGAGTRIKVLEAFAHHRPVVATPAAVAGIAVADGEQVLLGRTMRDVAQAVVSVLDDPALGDRLVTAAAATLHGRYAPDVVAATARRFVLGDLPGVA